MDVVISLMDVTKDGNVEYHDFVQELYKMKSSDSRTQLTFIKFYVAEILREVRAEMFELFKTVPFANGAL